MNVEQQITNGYIAYILAIGYDVYRNHIIMLIVNAPDFNTIIRTIIFRDVSQYQDLWDEEDHIDVHDIDSLIGVTQYETAGQFTYVIRTEQPEFHFTSSMPPEIIHH